MRNAVAVKAGRANTRTVATVPAIEINGRGRERFVMRRKNPRWLDGDEREDRAKGLRVIDGEDTCACVEGRVRAICMKAARIAIGTLLLLLP